MRPIQKLVAAGLILLFSGCATHKEQIQMKRWHDTSTGMEFVFVEGSCFEMGDIFGDGYDTEIPVHKVCVDGFWMGKYEVTQVQWEKVMGNNPSRFKNGDNYPVESVKWEDVQELLRRLNQMAGKRYRLPTEAEWEFAARSGGKREKWAGTSRESELGEYAWYSVNSGGTTHPVGQKQPNGLGLYDMSGNVWEWVQDWYDKNYYKNSPTNNPKGPSSLTTYRALRGGSWNDSPRNMRTSARSGAVGPLSRNPFIGFRVVLSAK